MLCKSKTDSFVQTLLKNSIYLSFHSEQQQRSITSFSTCLFFNPFMWPHRFCFFAASLFYLKTNKKKLTKDADMYVHTYIIQEMKGVMQWRFKYVC